MRTSRRLFFIHSLDHTKIKYRLNYAYHTTFMDSSLGNTAYKPTIYFCYNNDQVNPMMKCLEFNFKIVRCACWGFFFLEFSSVFRFTNNADEEKRYPSVWLNFPRPILISKNISPQLTVRTSSKWYNILIESLTWVWNFFFFMSVSHYTDKYFNFYISINLSLWYNALRVFIYHQKFSDKSKIEWNVTNKNRSCVEKL